MLPSDDNIPKLYKDIWVNHILPNVDEKSLLSFSAASKETRQAAFAALFKRPEFNSRMNRKINSLSGYDEAHFKYLRSNAKWGKAGSVTLIAALEIAAGLAAMYSLMGLLSKAVDGTATNELMGNQLSSIFLSGLAAMFAKVAFESKNQFYIDQYETERDLIDYRLTKMQGLENLRDELPKQVVVTEHSLFRKFIDTSEETKPSQFCTIL